MSSVDVNHQSDQVQEKKLYLAWNFPFVDLFTFVIGRKSRVIPVKKSSGKWNGQFSTTENRQKSTIRGR